MSEVSPRLVINASSGGSDWAVTAQAPIRLAMTAAKQGVRLVHVSSDAVFSGARVHYDESSLPDPISPYGAAKAAAETGVLAVYPEAVVARTSLIIGDGGQSMSASYTNSPPAPATAPTTMRYREPTTTKGRRMALAHRRKRLAAVVGLAATMSVGGTVLATPTSATRATTTSTPATAPSCSV